MGRCRGLGEGRSPRRDKNRARAGPIYLRLGKGGDLQV